MRRRRRMRRIRDDPREWFDTPFLVYTISGANQFIYGQVLAVTQPGNHQNCKPNKMREK
jgi:hypothetical protein